MSRLFFGAQLKLMALLGSPIHCISVHIVYPSQYILTNLVIFVLLGIQVDPGDVVMVSFFLGFRY